MRTEPEIRSILLTTRFGDPSRKAAPLACMLAGAHGARIHVLHVVPTGNTVVVSPLGIGEAAPAQVVERAVQDARRRLKEFVQQEVARLCPTVTQAVLIGTPVYEQIVTYAREQAIDLIVTGTHGEGMLHRMAFGSVTKAVVEHAPCPVLLVPCAKSRQTPDVEPVLLSV